MEGFWNQFPKVALFGETAQQLGLPEQHNGNKGFVGQCRGGKGTLLRAYRVPGILQSSSAHGTALPPAWHGEETKAEEHPT
jgi:hypothetical protein